MSSYVAIPTPGATAILETSGPTTLTIGAVAIGQILSRVGNTLVGLDVTPAQPFFQTVKYSAAVPYQQNVLKFATGTVAVVGSEVVYTPPASGAGDVVSGGVAGGQTINGGTAASENLTLISTAHATKGQTRIGSATGFIFDEVNTRLGFGGAPVAKLALGTDITSDFFGEVSRQINWQGGSGFPGIMIGADTTHRIGIYYDVTNSKAFLNAGASQINFNGGGIGQIMVLGAGGISGGDASGGNTTITSTQHATKGKILFGATTIVTISESNSRVGIGAGATTPSAQLHTDGAVRFANFGAGAATFDASGNISSASDERLKHVLRPYARGLADVVRISPVTYRWRTDSGLETEHEYSGFSAQNVQAAIPEAVSANAAGYLSLVDRALLAALVNAVRELRDTKADRVANAI